MLQAMPAQSEYSNQVNYYEYYFSDIIGLSVFFVGNETLCIAEPAAEILDLKHFAISPVFSSSPSGYIG